MEKNAFKPYFIILGLMLLTSLALAFTVDVSVTNEAGVKIFLPDRAGDWAGEDLRFCQNPACRLTFPVSRLDNPQQCPQCGGALKDASLAERQMLPPDTILLKKLYKQPSGNALHASLVMSGKETGSIHRPEVCLVGQGRRVEDRFTLAVPLDGREDLKVMVLELLDETRLPDGRAGPELQSYYAYWFVGKHRETPHHVERVIWMAWDRLAHNVAHRWAYIALGGGRNPGSSTYQAELQDFIRAFYPQMEFD